MIQRKAQGEHAYFLFMAMFVLFFVCIVGIVVSFLAVSVSDEMQNITVMQKSELNVAYGVLDAHPVMYDGLAFVVYAVIIITTFILARTFISTPVSYIVAWLLVLFVGVGMVGLGYALEMVVTNANFDIVTQNMYFIPFFASNAVFFAMFYFFLSMIAMYVVNE